MDSNIWYGNGEVKMAFIAEFACSGFIWAKSYSVY